MKPKASFKDKKGNFFVDCAECTRGGNGEGDCAAGCSYKRIKMGGCFLGKLLDKYDNVV